MKDTYVDVRAKLANGSSVIIEMQVLNVPGFELGGKKGIEQGIAQGIEQGIKTAQLQMAQKRLPLMDNAAIAELRGLTEQDIRALR